MRRFRPHDSITAFNAPGFVPEVVRLRDRAVVLAASFLLAGCAAPPAEPGGHADPEQRPLAAAGRHWQDCHSTHAGEWVIVAEAEWHGFWAANCSGARPIVDFGQEIVVAVFLGVSSTQLSVVVDGIRPGNAGSTVVATEHVACYGPEIESYPEDVATVPRSEGPYAFQRERHYDDCPREPDRAVLAQVRRT